MSQATCPIVVFTFVNITRKEASQLFPHDRSGTKRPRNVSWSDPGDSCHSHQIDRYIECLIFRILCGGRWISCLVRMIETRVSCCRTWINYPTMSDLSGETNLANLSRIIRINYSRHRLWLMCVLFALDPKRTVSCNKKSETCIDSGWNSIINNAR